MIDEIDKKIIQYLLKDGKASVEAVAGVVGLSPTPTRRRIRNLENAGVIRGYSVELDLARCGLELTMYVFVKLQQRDRDTIKKFEKKINALPQIIRCDLLTGAFDYILLTQASTMADYDRFLRSVLAELPGVLSIETNVVITSVKDEISIPA